MVSISQLIPGMCLRGAAQPQVDGIPRSSNPNGQGSKVTLSIVVEDDRALPNDSIGFSTERISFTSSSILVMEYMTFVQL